MRVVLDQKQMDAWIEEGKAEALIEAAAKEADREPSDQAVPQGKANRVEQRADRSGN